MGLLLGGSAITIVEFLDLLIYNFLRKLSFKKNAAPKRRVTTAADEETGGGVTQGTQFQNIRDTSSFDSPESGRAMPIRDNYSTRYSNDNNKSSRETASPLFSIVIDGNK